MNFIRHNPQVGWKPWRTFVLEYKYSLVFVIEVVISEEYVNTNTHTHAPTHTHARTHAYNGLRLTIHFAITRARTQLPVNYDCRL